MNQTYDENKIEDFYPLEYPPELGKRKKFVLLKKPYIDEIFNTNTESFKIEPPDIETYCMYIEEYLNYYLYKPLYMYGELEHDNDDKPFRPQYKLVVLFKKLEKLYENSDNNYRSYKNPPVVQQQVVQEKKPGFFGRMLGQRGGETPKEIARTFAELLVLLKQFTYREKMQLNAGKGDGPLRKRLTSIDNVIPDNIEDLKDDEFFNVVSNVKKVILKMRRGNWQGKLGFGEYLYMLREPVKGKGWFGERETSEYGLHGGKTRRKFNRKTRRKSNRKTRRRSRRKTRRSRRR